MTKEPVGEVPAMHSSSSVTFQTGSTEEKSKQDEEEKIMFQTGSTAKKGGAAYNGPPPDIVYSGGLLDCVLKIEDEDRVKKVCAIFQMGALVGFLIWIILLALVFTFAPADSYEQPHGIEQGVHVLSFVLLLLSNGSRLYPFILRDKSLNFFRNGVVVAIATVQMIAMISNLGMGLLPTPVFDDQITGMRVNLVRWVELTPLCFLMTFLLDNMDAPLSINDPPQRWSLAIILTLATACGGIFPFCRNLKEWLMVVTTAWCLFTSLFFKLYAQAKRYYSMKAELSRSAGVEARDDELFELARVSYTLTCICTITWTLLAACFTFVAAAQAWAPKGSLLAEPHLQNVMLSSFDIMSKIWYLSGIIDAYDNFFDESARAVRRLEDLRNFMTAIWESSSDIIIFTGKKANRVHARISPAFFRMIGSPSAEQGRSSLILEIFPKTQTYYVFAIDLSKTVTWEKANAFRQTFNEKPRSIKDTSTKSLEDQNIAIMVEIAIKACGAYVGNGRESSFLQDLPSKDHNDIKCLIHCEAKVADFEHSCLIVLRNISDRIQRFEADKNLLRESTIRRKDAEANQFTRHEVKNGILAAIGILEHLRESTNNDNVSRVTNLNDMESISNGTTPGLARRSSYPSMSVITTAGADNYDELESTLRDMLDTVVYEAMAREIIYGEYESRRERLNVPAVLASLQHGSSKLFPLTFEPIPFPNIFLDRQLLRYIFRNAVSNASRYGQPNGTVEAKARFDHAESKFIMEVINLPGPGHQDLVKLSREEVLRVFEPGIQLTITRSAAPTHHAETTKNESQGSGAWIMKLSAEALGGVCDIRFELKRTVFTFWCPSKACDRDESKATQGARVFELPASVWGVAVDDSKVQRKLLGHFMKIAGIDTSRRVVLGENDDEITSFGERLKKLLLANPDDKFLVLVDENLDLSDGMQKTISGSLSVQKLREELDEETESRMLVLIRSANDSATDVETYKARAHGFMQKEPIKKGEVLDSIQPWWDARFPPDG